MAVRKLYEEKILEIIKDIPEHELAQVLHLIKMRSTEPADTFEFGDLYGNVQTSSDEFTGKYQEIY